MSTYGFEIQNAAGQVVADTNFPVYTPVQYGSFSTGGTANVWTFTDVYFSAGVDISKMPQFFMELPTNVSNYGAPTICVHSYFMSGTAITGVRIHSYFYSAAASVNYSVNYVVAVPVSAADVGSADYGIMAYDSSGNVTFNSGKRLVTIKAISTMNVGDTLTHPAIYGTRYVAVAGLAGIKVTPVYYPYYYGYIYFGGIRAASATSVSLAWNVVALNATTLNTEALIPTSVIVAELGA